MPKFGFNCTVNRNTAATWANPTWAPIEAIRDATLDATPNEADVTTRGSGGFDQTEPTTIKAEVSFSLLYEPADADYLALETAYQTKAALDLAILDGPIATAGSRGLRAKWKIFGWKRNEALRDAVTIDVTIKPCYEITNPPTWFVAP